MIDTVAATGGTSLYSGTTSAEAPTSAQPYCRTPRRSPTPTTAPMAAPKPACSKRSKAATSLRFADIWGPSSGSSTTCLTH